MRFLFTALLLLSACAPRDKLVFYDGPLPEPSVTRAVFVATTREPEGARFGGKRGEKTQYLRYDISVPPERPTGQILVPTRQVDPKTQFLARGRQSFADSGAFRSDLNRALSRRRGNEREVILYVHGFNNTFDEGVLRISQLAEDFGVKGVAVHYSWPSAGSALGYAYDRDSLLISRDGLDSLITDLRASGARSIILVAHSVGSMLVMETLRQRAIARPGSVSRDIEGVILMSPDIDVELFRAQARRIGKLPQPFGIFVSKRDRVLSLSARLTGQRNRLGNVDRVERVADLDVTIVDVTDFSEGAGHFTVGTSPALIRIFSQAGALDTAFRGDRAGRTGLLPGTILTVQATADILLAPMTAIVEATQQ